MCPAPPISGCHGQAPGPARPADDHLTLEDLDRFGLEAAAGCMSCETLRVIRVRERLPGWSKIGPLAEMFADGKIRCAGHKLRAMRLLIREVKSREVVAEWRWSG